MVDESGNPLTVDEICDRLFKAIDKDGDGEWAHASLVCLSVNCSTPYYTLSGMNISYILLLFSEYISLEEFLEGAQNDPWVRNCLKLDVNPCAWVNKHQGQITGYKKSSPSSKGTK